ncbi:MAG: sugar transferase [Terriglobia bacterium]|jgi:exopolysaccharide biosynthesis polyprenyl glycosylphosphotransferase
MSNARRQAFLALLKIFDLMVMVACFSLAAVPVLYRSGLSVSEFFSMRVKVQNFVVFVGLLFVWHIIFASFSLYESRRLVPRESEILDTLKATSLCAFALAAAALLFHIGMVDLPFLVVLWGASSTMIISSRLAIRFFLNYIRKRGRNLRHVLIVGTNARAVQFARRIESKEELGFRVIGFADQKWPGLKTLEGTGNRLVCGLNGIADFVRNAVVDEIVIALPLRSFYVQAAEIAVLCEEQGIVMRFLPRIFNLHKARSTAEEMGGDSLLTLSTGPLDGWPVFVKRGLDVVLSSVLLLVLSPLLLLTALVVKLTSPGPVLFRQRRVGLNKRQFWICKFRTMVPDAEKRMAELEKSNEVSGPVFKIKNDPRLTPVGKFLRSTSIDELPQLLNVLRGDMSLVGPRPLPIRDCQGFEQDWHRRRFSVRPGITCLWQVNGRSSVPFERWMELDMQYIDEWSLWLDFKILAGTIPAVLKGSGAV